MFYNTASHLLFLILFQDIDVSIARVCNCNIFALTPWQEEYIQLQKYNISISFHKVSSKHYPITITTDNNNIFLAIKEYIHNNTFSIALRVSMVTKKILKVTFSDEVPSENASLKIPHVSITASFHDDPTNNDVHSFTIYVPLEFFKLFRIKANDLTKQGLINDIELQFLQFFRDPYNLFPSLEIILERMEDNELQKLIYFLLNENVLTPYHLYLLTRAFPQHALKIKYNISSNLISDIMHVGQVVKNIKTRDLIEGIYAFEEILYLKLRSKQYFKYGNFIDKINKILHFITILSTFQKKNFETWFNEIENSGLLYTILSHCTDSTIASAFSNHTFLLQKLSLYISSRRLQSIHSYFKNKFNYMDTMEAQYSLIQLYLSHMSQINKLYSMPFHKLYPKYINSDSIYYLLFELGWFTLATAFKQLPKKLVHNCTQKLPIGAQYCIMDMINGVLNPNLLHDEMQIKKSQYLLIQSIIKLYYHETIHHVE
ncbi:MAG: hypothetical protein N3F66_00305 [Spirochaetes bacterium]|nr:hypothetical protein [Spirochaetota bacterium]